MLKTKKVSYQKTVFDGKTLRREGIINLNLLFTGFLPYRYLINYKP